MDQRRAARAAVLLDTHRRDRDPARRQRASGAHLCAISPDGHTCSEGGPMTQTEKAIRAFRGKQNASLRKLIRARLESAEPQSVLEVRKKIALSYLGEAKLQAVWEAWQ